MSKRVVLTLWFMVLFALTAVAAVKPNIVFIYADDLGYGDVGCYGAARVKTPNIDRLATEGLRFTDAHSPSATCTPSRYALLTGEYAWRKKGTGVLPGDAKLIIDPSRVTLASMLRNAGYITGAIGKWHLGLGAQQLDWNAEIKPGPIEIGFNTCFITPATGDRVPCVYVQDHRVVGLESQDPLAVSFAGKIGNEPTGKENPELLKMRPSHGHDMTIVNGISRIGYMSGAHAARWKDEDMADVLTRRAVNFIEQNKSKPFFLYFATHDVHVPRVPNPRFVGKTEMGPRGDVIVELDWTVGEIMAALKRNKLDENTLLVFSSDNGPVVDDGYRDGAVEKLGDHKPAGQFRGGKYSIFEGGTRVPMIVRWTGRVKPGTSDALVCQVDFLASFAALVGEKIPENAGPDSLNTLPALLGDSRSGREVLVEHAGSLGLRKNKWKYIEPGRGARFQKNTSTELGNAPEPQLYDVAADPGEKNNLASQQPERVKELAAALQKIRADGRSR
jgi:arylsulfatase A-like enzyme